MTITKCKVKVRPLYLAKNVAKAIEDGAPVPEPSLLVPKFELKITIEGDEKDVREIVAAVKDKGQQALTYSNSKV